jgi:hypothetical protein
MTNDKGNDRLNEVLGSREAVDDTECEAGKRNSAPLGQRCSWPFCACIDGECTRIGTTYQLIEFASTGREALQELSGCPNV